MKINPKKIYHKAIGICAFLALLVVIGLALLFITGFYSAIFKHLGTVAGIIAITLTIIVIGTVLWVKKNEGF